LAHCKRWTRKYIVERAIEKRTKTDQEKLGELAAACQAA
jgi:hypothetical protein